LKNLVPGSLVIVTATHRSPKSLLLEKGGQCACARACMCWRES